MPDNIVLLVYNVENLNAATAMGNALQHAHFKVDYFGLSPDIIGKDTYAQINARTEPVIILISDNFLKSEAGMEQALSTIQDLHRHNRLIPVITDGIHYNDRTGLVTNITTSFERVSNVIQYMNFWQDRYLELRKIKKDPGTAEDDHHNEQIKSVRAISTEIGELLRFLRSIDCYHYDDLAAYHFNSLMQLLKKGETETEPGAGNNNGYSDSSDYKGNTNGLHFPAETGTEQEIIILESGMNKDLETTEIEPEKITVVATEDEIVNEYTEESDEPKFDEIVEIIRSGEEDADEEKVVQDTHQGDNEPLAASTTETTTQAETTTTRNIKNAYIETLLEEAETTKNSQATGFRSQLNDIVEEVIAEEKGINEEELYFSEEEPDEDSDLDSLFEQEKTEKKISMEDVFIMPGQKAQEEEDEIDEEIIKQQVSMYLKTPEIAGEEIQIDEENHPETTSDEGIETTEEEEPIIEPITATENEPGENPEISLAQEADEAPAAESISEIIDHEAANISTMQVPVTEVTETVLSSKEKELIEQSLELYANGHIEEGRTAFETFLNDNPESVEARMSYARCLAFQEHHPAKAVSILEKVLSVDDRHIPAYLMLGELAEMNKEYLLAQSYFQQVADINPETPGIFYHLGLLTNNHFKGQRKKAAKYFKTAFEMDPSNGDAGFQYANILLEHFGKAKKAARYYQDIVKNHPDNDKAWLALAEIFYENSDQASANECYLKATGINPDLQSDELDEKYAYTAPVVEEEQFQEPVPVAPVYPEDNGITVMITGATSGIGLATAQLLASQGYRLILTGRRLDRLESIEQQIKEQFQTKTHCLNFDVRHLEETRKAILSLDENWGQIDILINNAGLASGFESIHEGHIDDWETMIDTNIKGLLYMTRAIAPQMVARQKGHIINISSAAAIDAYPKGNVYCATKAAVEMLTKSIRLDLYQYGIRVSQVSPGHVEETEFAKVRFHGDMEKAQIYQDFQPLKAKDVADAIWYMISRPEYVNINDIVITSTQQANTIFINRNGRKEDMELE